MERYFAEEFDTFNLCLSHAKAICNNGDKNEPCTIGSNISIQHGKDAPVKIGYVIYNDTQLYKFYFDWKTAPIL